MFVTVMSLIIFEEGTVVHKIVLRRQLSITKLLDSILFKQYLVVYMFDSKLRLLGH